MRGVALPLSEQCTLMIVFLVVESVYVDEIYANSCTAELSCYINSYTASRKNGTFLTFCLLKKLELIVVGFGTLPCETLSF